MGHELAGRLSRRIGEAKRQHPAMTDDHVAGFLDISLYQWERIRDGEARPTADQLVLLADLMGVEPGWFFRDSTERPTRD